MVRRTIPIPEDLYKIIEELAVQNYRTFNLEIAKALDFYIKSYNGQAASLDLQVNSKVNTQIQEQVISKFKECKIVEDKTTLEEYEDVEIDEL